MSKPRTRIAVASFVMLLACAASLAGEAPAAEPDPFDQLLAKVQADPRGVGEEQVKQLLAMAAQRGRCHVASLAVKSHLAHNFSAPPGLVRLAADNALLAGDFRTAAARYKAYLAAAPGAREAPAAAATLYHVLVDFLDAEDDAYQFMAARGEKHRRGTAARKFDAWFLDQARRRGDCAGMAKALTLAFAQKLPLEQERLYFWEYLDWLMTEVARGRNEHFDALPFCRRLVPLVRGSKRRTLKYGLCVAHLAFKAGAAGKDAAALDAAYGSAVAAAKAYFDAMPTASTVKDIVWVFTDGGVGGGFDDAAWQRQSAPKRAFFVQAFGKLNDAERLAILAWRLPNGDSIARRLASREQWAELGSRHRRLFLRCDAVRDLPFVTKPDSRDLFKAQAAFLAGVPSLDAAAINAMAASDDLAKCVDHLMAKEAWHLGFHHPWHILDGTMWPAHQAIGKKAGKEPSHGDYRKVILHFGTAWLSKTPAALDRHAARAYIDAAWSLLPDDNKAGMVEHLERLQWVPYRDRGRKDLFQHTFNSFRNWAGRVRRELRQKQPKIKPEAAQQIAPIEAAFRRAMDTDAVDPNRAPNPLCKALALAVVAEEARDGKAFAQQARALYPMVKDYEAKKTPFGRAVLEFILKNRTDRFDTTDFQIEAVRDQLARLGTREPDDLARFVCDTVIRHDHGRSWWRVPREGKARALALNALFAKALLDRMAKGAFSPTLFEWFRATRSGDHWRQQDAGEDVMAQVIETKALHKTDYRPDPAVPSATVSYMRLVRHEFPGLNARYPVDRYFDDMFVAEAKRTGYLDRKYWDYGVDREKKVVNAAAQLLQKHQALPFDYNGGEVAYARSDFWDWQTRALGADPATRDALIAQAEKAYGKTRFDSFAMGRTYFNVQADASTPKGRAEFFSRLKAYLGRARQAPVRLPPPYLGQLEKLGNDPKLTNDELDILLSVFPDCTPLRWPGGWHFDRLVRVVAQGLLSQKREGELYRLIPHFWKIARDTGSHDLQRGLARLAVDLADGEEHDLALVCSNVGLTMLETRLPEDARSTLAAVRSKSLSSIGGVIPVKRDDRRYPVYAAQAAYLGGRHQSAWELYLSRRKLAGTLIKELDPGFCIWLIGRHTQMRDFEQAEELARAMIQWFDSVADGFQPEVRAQLLLSYAGIALARREFPRARALFERIAAAQEFAGTRAQRDADLRVAEVDRLTGRFDQAVKRLDTLSRSKDPTVQAESYYGMALVRFDQEEYREALDHLGQVFARVPDHANGKILEGRAKVKMRKLEEPTEIQIGTVTRRRFLVPGKPLRVSLEDRNLAVVGSSTDIELRAWTDGGDEEIFSLMPFGDSKTKFRGSLPTVLGPPTKGDRTLQVLGNDVVHYDFSGGFRKEHRIALRTPETLQVTTDAELLVSSGAILTKQEREALALERLIRKRLGEKEEKPQAALSTVRREDQIKPGNALNVRVIDPDRGETAQKDKLVIRVATSSGDSIKAFALAESGTYSGVFEGAVPTASGHAVAFASDSDDGKEPTFAISAKDYPPWVALPDNQRPKLFGVDLNDNVALGKMTVTANVPGRKLKRFLVQTSLNAQDFTTVGSWPEPLTPWDGAPRIEIVRYGRQNKAPGDIAALRGYLDRGHITDGCPKFTLKATAMAERFDSNVRGLAGKMELAGDREGSWYIIHHYAAFYQPVRRIRTFDVEAKALREAQQKAGRPRTQYMLTIDGEGGETPTKVRRSLGKGAHRIDLYVCATRRADPQYAVRVDSDQAPFMVVCPAGMFDPAKHPQIRIGVRREPAKVVASEDGARFDVAFPEGTQARVVRLLMVDFETDAPAINKIALTNAEGTAVLPAKEDFMDLRSNNVLEIIPGDRVTVSYDDPRVVTEGREHHEAFLTATFSNATLSACFVEYTVDGAGERKARYIPMRRFKPGDKINVFISDPDCDVSDKQDTVTFAARTSEGQPVELPALETDGHSGVFVGGVFPVAKAPERDSELKVVEGDDVIVSYLDRENTDPGIPWTRSCAVEQTWYEPPQVRVYGVASQPLPEGKGEARAVPTAEELVPVTRSLVATWPEAAEPEKPTAVLIGGPLLVEVVFPFIAQSPESTAAIYVQTASGRQAHGKEPKGAFDVSAPGTLRLESRPSNVPSVSPPPGYREVLVRGNPYAADALDDGRFTFSVPMALGVLPEGSLAGREGEAPAEPQKGEPPTLAIKGGDEIFIGFEFADDQGEKRWVTRRVVLDADSFFHVMDRRYREELTGVYVGESLHFRAIDPTRDRTDEKDEVTVAVQTASGGTRELKLAESFSHSGVFKGHAKIVYKGEGAEAEGVDALACQYGDTVTATYKRPDAQAGIACEIAVYKGSDGVVLPFTKRFKDPAIAVQTQFTVAEAYFEMAKRHRALGQASLARREIAQGKKLLEEAIRDYPETEARAQADYLLAELALEFANDAKDSEAKKKHYTEAVGRFTDIVASYPDSPYAPKAQYKKALVFEKMGQIDQACEEYVKLSYRYPDNELVAETIARLGQYFLTKGKAQRAKAEAEADAVEREKLEIQARDMYKTAAQVFGRLAVRFPNHRLAGKTAVLSAQCYMQADDPVKAVEVFQATIQNPKMDKDLVAESMYWCGDCHMRQEDYVNAYRVFKKLTWDYPASKWAKFARGRLSEEALANAAEADQ